MSVNDRGDPGRQCLTMVLERDGAAREVPGDPASALLFRGEALLLWHWGFPVTVEIGIVDLLLFSSWTDAAIESSGLYETGLPREVEPYEDREEPPPMTPAEIRADIERRALTLGDWWEPDEGLEAVRAMLRYCDRHPRRLANHPHGAGIREDLRRLGRALVEAKRRGRRFRLRQHEC